MLVGLTALAWSQTAPLPAAFHHVHLTGERSISLYEGLFEAQDVERLTILGADALRIGRVLFVASKSRVSSPPGDSAIWHYGWGAVSLQETYVDHNLREVAWEPPLPADGFHLHLESVTPIGAATWYRDHFGAGVELAPDVEHVSDRDWRRPMALVRVGRVGMLLYRADQPLASTRGKPVDHLAFAVDDVAAAIARLQAADVTVLEPPHSLAESIVALVEGPDRLAIELVQAVSP